MPVFTALHRMLGMRPGDLTSEMIDAAVERQLREADDLDWKSKLPPRSKLSDTDFPKDVAAMANRGGGTLVYGVSEKQKAATGRVDVGELDENHEGALRGIAVSGISPPVLRLDIYKVGDPGNQAVVVVVPPSTDGPHMIFSNELFGVPLRVDAYTAWMREPQIAAMYRARFDELRRSRETLSELYEEAAANWYIRDHAQIVAVAHPRLPATVSARPSREEASAMMRDAERWALTFAGRGGVHPLESVDRYNQRRGLRRWVAPNTATSDTSRWKTSWAAIHDDGSVTLASSVGGHRMNQGFRGGNEIESSAIECAVADFMALLRAANTGLGIGEYEVQVGVEWGGDMAMRILTVDNQGYSYDDNSTPLAVYTPVTTTVRADADDVDFYWQVHDLAEDCVNQGGITYVRMISPPDRKTAGG